MAQVRVSRTRMTTGVVGRLNAEWALLADDPAGADACRRWAGECPALAGTRSLAGVLERVPAAADDILLNLLSASAAGDTLAGRVVLQAMLGKVVKMAGVDHAASVDDYVAALWCQVATYPGTARPTRVAANLSLDTLKAVQRERRPAHDAASPPDVVAEVAEVRPQALVASSTERNEPPLTARAVIRTAEQRALVDTDTGALLRTVYAEGLTGRAAAERHAISAGSVRVRCSRALAVLARHAPALANAA